MRSFALSSIVLALGCRFSVDDIPVRTVDADGGRPPAERPRHASCKLAFPADALEPEVATDATGRPAFDLYRDLPCDVADGDACGTGEREPNEACRICLSGSEPRVGLCLPDAARIEDATVVSTRSGSCYGVVDAATKRRACCGELPGLDCRPWPFEVPSRPGQLCRSHDDCEAGLVCETLPYVAGLGLAGACQCPELGNEPTDANAAGCEIAP